MGATTAVGRTPAVSGGIELDGITLSEATFTADLTELVSDESRRDDAIQRALETATFPEATFTLTEPVDLTVHGVTRPVEVPLQVSLTGGAAVVTGSFDVAFADYGVNVPTAPVVLSVEDSGVVGLQLFLSPPS